MGGFKSKIISSCCLMICMFAIFCSAKAKADGTEEIIWERWRGNKNQCVVDGVRYYYDINGKYARIGMAEPVDAAPEIIHIPEKLDGYIVAAIGYEGDPSIYPDENHTFEEFRRTVKEIVVPDTVTKLFNHVFGELGVLEKLTLPSHIKEFPNFMCYGCSSLKGIDFPEGLISIGDSAFMNTSLERAVLPNSVVSIGEYAFGGKLAELVLPEGIEIISDGNFEGITSKEITIPDSVKEIGKRAFSGSPQLEKVNFGKNIEKIGYGAFEQTPWLEQRETAEYDILADKILYKYNGSSDKPVIPEGVTCIMGGAFEDLPITSVSIPSSVKYIGNRAFSGCEQLKEVELPENLIQIGQSAFSGSGLTRITIPASVTRLWSDGGTGVFSECKDLKEIKVNNPLLTLNYLDFSGTAWLKARENDAFIMLDSILLRYNGNSKNPVLPKGTVNLAEMAFWNKPVAFIEIPETVKYIGPEALFRGAERVYFKGDAPDIGEDAFVNVTVPKEYAKIFYLEGKEGFDTEHWSVYKPELYKHIDIAWEQYAGHKNSCTVDGVQYYYDIQGEYARIGFIRRARTDMVRPEGTGPEILTIPAALDGYIVAAIGEEGYTQEYREDRHTFDNYQWNLKEIVVPDTVTKLYHQVFGELDTLEKITLPDHIEALPGYIFYGCKNLKKIEFPKQLTTIGDSAFAESGLECAVIPDSVVSIGQNAFGGCKDLVEAVLPEGIETIKNRTFSMTALKEITIPDSVKEIGEMVFTGAKQLETIHFGKNISNIGYGTFSGTPWLAQREAAEYDIIADRILLKYNGSSKEPVIPEGITCIMGEALMDSLITSVKVPSSVKYIGAMAFAGCEQLKEIELPENLIQIGTSAFAGSGLTKITVPASVTRLGRFTFSQCKDLEEIKFLNDLSVLHYYDFEETPWLKARENDEFILMDNKILLKYNGSSTTPVIPKGTVNIAGSAFSDKPLTFMEIPATVKYIGQTAFMDSGLEQIYFKGDAPEIGGYVFVKDSDGEGVFNYSKVYYLDGKKDFDTAGWSVYEPEIYRNHTVTFDADNGSKVITEKVYTGQTVSLPKVTRKGYEFAGWYDGKREFKPDTVITYNDGLYALKAKWKAVSEAVLEQETVYTVKKGDTLFKLAKKYNTTIAKIAKENKIKDPDYIIIGQKLNIVK